MKCEKVNVREEDFGKRLDVVVCDLQGEISRNTVQRLIDEENIKVNGKRVKASYRVQLNDRIEISVPDAKEVDIRAEDIPLDIIYEDDDIIVINKPKGMVVHPANGNMEGTLVNAVMAIVHRLDKDTSGAIIVAKNDRAHIDLSNQLKEHKIKKTYIALVRGIIRENEATIDMPIARSQKDRKKMAVSKDGKNAITHFKVLR